MSVAAMQLEFHPAANELPMMEGAAFDDFRADIAAHGLLEAVILHEGKILDGRNRYRACVELGIEPVFEDWDGDGDPFDYVISVNVHRRHLAESQRAMHAARAKPRFEAEAKERQGTRTDISANLRGSSAISNVQTEAGTQACKASEAVAERFNVSPRSVESADKILKKGVPELAKAVDAGQVKVSTAAVVADLPKEEQASLVAKGPDAIKETAKTIREEKRPESTKGSVFALDPALPESTPVATSNGRGLSARELLKKYMRAVREALGGVEAAEGDAHGLGGFPKAVAGLSRGELADLDKQLDRCIRKMRAWTDHIKELKRR